MAYLRHFMPLECEATGYGFKGRTPAGRSIVESRDGSVKISVWAQDIRPETRYGCYLIFPEAGRYIGIFAGQINADDKGKAEMRKDIEFSDLSGFSLEELVAVAIIAADNSAVISPLCGYKDRAVSWRGGFKVKSAEEIIPKPEPISEPEIIQEEEPSLEAGPEIISEPETIPEPEIIPEPEPTLESNPEIIPEPEPTLESNPEIIPEEEPTLEAEPEIIPEEEPALESKPEIIPEPEAVFEPPPEIEDDECTPPEEPVKPARSSQKTAPRARRPQNVNPTSPNSDIRNEDILALESIFKSKKSISPIEIKDLEVKWVQLGISDPVPLPYNRPQLLEEPFVRAAYANYDHLILGITADGAEYIIGVPGEYSPELRPQAKRLGFKKFVTDQGRIQKRGDFGYWLMIIPI